MSQEQYTGKHVFFECTETTVRGLVGAFSGETSKRQTTERGEIIAAKTVKSFFTEKTFIVIKTDRVVPSRYVTLNLDDIVFDPDDDRESPVALQ